MGLVVIIYCTGLCFRLLKRCWTKMFLQYTVWIHFVYGHRSPLQWGFHRLYASYHAATQAKCAGDRCRAIYPVFHYIKSCYSYLISIILTMNSCTILALKVLSSNFSGFVCVHRGTYPLWSFWEEIHQLQNIILPTAFNCLFSSI